MWRVGKLLPGWGYSNPAGISVPQKHRKLMNLKFPRNLAPAIGPPEKFLLTQTFMELPESLAIEKEPFYGRNSAVAEQKQCSPERILFKSFPTHTGQAVNPISEIDRIYRYQNTHHRRDLDHVVTSHSPLTRETTSKPAPSRRIVSLSFRPSRPSTSRM